MDDFSNYYLFTGRKIQNWLNFKNKGILSKGYYWACSMAQLWCVTLYYIPLPVMLTYCYPLWYYISNSNFQFDLTWWFLIWTVSHINRSLHRWYIWLPIMLTDDIATHNTAKPTSLRIISLHINSSAVTYNVVP